MYVEYAQYTYLSIYVISGIKIIRLFEALLGSDCSKLRL